MNHSSDKNPLFQDSLFPQSEQRDWYIWSVDHPQDWKVWGRDPWHQTQHGSYYGLFWRGMPDFNLRHPDVQAYHKNNLKYWLNLGVDGFRFDATGHLFENGKNGWDNQPENHLLLKQIQDLLKQYSNRFMICESTSEPAPYADSCGSVFSFGMQKHLFDSVLQGKIQKELTNYIDDKPLAQMGTLLSNHDSFAGQRTFDQLDGNETLYKLIAATYLTLPGMPFIYYGEEIGMSQANEKVQDHKLRAPMSWTATGGFTEAKQAFRSNALNSKTHNVEDQLQDPQSLLNFYKTIIKLRKKYPALSIGEYQKLETDKNMFVFKRSYQGQTLLILFNYAKQEDHFIFNKTKILTPVYLTPNTTIKEANKISMPAQSFAIYII